MSIASILAAAGITLPAAMLGIYWLVRTLIEHRLSAAMEIEKNSLAAALEEKKAALQAELNEDQASIEGAVRQAVELELGKQAAERQYAFEARRRLYLAVGPLRFQLLLASRDFASRITSHGQNKRYNLTIKSYYGQSTLYRLLRPLALCELIERQIAYSDFSVDEGAIDCLRLKKTLGRMLSSDEILCKHPKADWDAQIEHVYADNVTVGASALICREGESQRVMRFDEFRAALAKDGPATFEPFVSLLEGFDFTKKPILWLRLVAYAYASVSFISKSGASLGFEDQKVPLADLIALGEDGFICGNKDRFVEVIEANALMRL